jgi:hypothetical protein
MDELQYYCDHREICGRNRCYHYNDHVIDEPNHLCSILTMNVCVNANALVQCRPVGEDIYFIKKKKKNK